MHAVVGPVWKSNPWTAAYRQERLEPSERPVGWLSGSCLLLRRQAFDAIDGFDERYFMYMEDVDLGDRLAGAGWQNVYVPSAEVLHDKGHSTGRDPARNLAAHHTSTYTFLADRHSRLAAGSAAVDHQGGPRGARASGGRQLSAQDRERTADSVNPAEVDAVVLVGGQGTRLRPLTLSAPKPMLPTAGLPFLTHLLSRIAAAGIQHVVLGTSYKAEVFEAEFGDGSKLGLQIDYVVEDEPRGTGGGIANVASKLRYDTALVFNGDVLSGADLGALLASHEDRDADLTLHLVRVGDPRAFGCVPTDADGGVTAFLEKTQDPPTDQINAGCYVFKREVIDRIPTGRAVSVEREVFPALLSDGLKVCGYVDATLLARHGHARRLRPRLRRSGPRHRAVARAEGAPRARNSSTTVPPSGLARC